MKPTIAITIGDPTGVGPEVVLKALTDRKIKQLCTPVVLGDEAVLKHISAKCKMQIANCKIINLSHLNPKKLTPGKPDKICAKAMMTYIEEAVFMALGSDIDAIVTGPISKEAINKAGYKDKVKIGMDVAASSFYEKGIYKLKINGREKKLKSAGLLAWYKKLLAESARRAEKGGRPVGSFA